MASPRVGINFNRFKISKREALIKSVVTFFRVFLAKMCDHYWTAPSILDIEVASF